MEAQIEDGMESLSIPECERLIDQGGIGILALCGVEAPILRPINFMLQEGRVILRTGIGQILEASQGAEPASFVVCKTDGLEHTGWSVVITGRLMDHSEMVGVPYLPIRPWARAEKNNFVGLSVDTISGRRIAPPGSPS
jgi:uncharacterized protein